MYEGDPPVAETVTVPLFPPKQLTGVLLVVRLKAASFATIITCVHVDELPLTSFAVHITEVVPNENCAGSTGLLEKLLIPQLSLNESGLNEIGSVILAQLGMVRLAFGGQMIVGISLSLTVTVKLQVTDEPNASVTL